MKSPKQYQLYRNSCRVADLADTVFSVAAIGYIRTIVVAYRSQFYESVEFYIWLVLLLVVGAFGMASESLSEQLSHLANVGCMDIIQKTYRPVGDVIDLLLDKLTERLEKFSHIAATLGSIGVLLLLLSALFVFKWSTAAFISLSLLSMVTLLLARSIMCWQVLSHRHYLCCSMKWLK